MCSYLVIIRTGVCRIRKACMKTYGLELVRTVTGDGRWLLHDPREDIPFLIGGTAELGDDGEWSRPDANDYDRARRVRDTLFEHREANEAMTTMDEAEAASIEGRH